MNTQEIIANIDNIYDRFSTPWFLRKHMYDTVAVAQYIIAHWKGPPLDEELIVATLLLHDLGNVMYVHRDRLSDLYGLSDEELDALELRQAEFSQKYGTGAKEVTKNMIAELNVEQRIVDLLHEREASNIKNLIHTENWNAKIACYPDLRVSPDGIVPRSKRLADVLRRYKHRVETIRGRKPFVDELVQQIFEHTDISPEDITVEIVADKQ